MRLIRRASQICAGRQYLSHPNGHCLHVEKHGVLLNRGGTTLSVQCNREMTSDSTVDMKSNAAGRKKFRDGNMKKKTVKQPEVCSAFFIRYS